VISRRSLFFLPALLLLGTMLAPVGASAQEVSFSDTQGTSQARAVNALAAEGIILGCEDDRFCPGDELTRGQAASILARALDLPDADTTDRFSDTANDTHRRAIDAVAEAGIVQGCEDGAFCPRDRITRQQLATMLTNAFDVPAASAAGSDLFVDVEGGHAPAVASITEAGIANGCDLVNFCARDALQRGHAALFFARALDLVDRVDIAPFSERQAEHEAIVAAEREAAEREAERLAAAQAGPGERAVEVALAQLGKPYAWGGNGPNSFDCSGLTSFAWRAAGVELPRTSAAQYSGTTRISRSDLRPGDLVFYHSPVSHVAMYIGDGKVVEAPNSGNNVRIRNDGLTRSGVVGYGRP
jgi:cell wall-associated NlpC family hydrolase